MLIMKDFCKLEKLLSRPPKILSECPKPNLENISDLKKQNRFHVKNIGGVEELNSLPDKNTGGVEELNSLPDKNTGGVEELNGLPDKNTGGVEELNSLPDKNTGGVEELNDCLCGNIEYPHEPKFGRYTHRLSDSKTRAGIFQPPALVSPKSKIPSKPAKNKGSKQGNNNNKPLPMAELSKVIFQRMPFVSYKKLLYYYDDGIFKPCLQADFLELLWEILSKDELAKYNLLNFRNAYTFITSNPDIKIDDFPVYEYCAVCNDYMVNIANGEYRKISHNDLVTSKINADYIPQSNLYTPMFDNFLSCVSNGDKQLERLICEVIGWCCTLPNHSKKVFFVLGYAPDSGKSVIGNFLKMLYGEDLVSHVPIGDMGTRFGTSPIIGKAINISMDLPSSTLNSMAVSAVKMLTGGDGISIDIKYMSQIQYKQPIHLLFASNHPIKLAEYDDAFYNRMVFVPFNNSVSHEQQDHELLKKLWQERDGIVTKCLFAVQDMLYEGRSFSCESYNPDEYCNDTFDSDSIRDYVNENIIISRDKADELSTSDMYIDYRNWCNSNDLMPEAQCKFSTYISKMYGINKRKKHTSESNVWVFVGVRYKTP